MFHVEHFPSGEFMREGLWLGGDALEFLVKAELRRESKMFHVEHFWGRVMTYAERDGWRRLTISGTCFAAWMLLFLAALYFLGPILKPYEKSSYMGWTLVCLLVLWFGSLLGVVLYVTGPMKSRCPQCQQRKARLVLKRHDQYHLKCLNCEFDEPTGLTTGGY